MAKPILKSPCRYFPSVVLFREDIDAILEAMTPTAEEAIAAGEIAEETLTISDDHFSY